MPLINYLLVLLTTYFVYSKVKLEEATYTILAFALSQGVVVGHALANNTIPILWTVVSVDTGILIAFILGIFYFTHFAWAELYAFPYLHFVSIFMVVVQVLNMFEGRVNI
ncbi:hypothetical protein BX667DRAFT_497808 [Coemansia mojavensis]|nr:hypothetical protein BX667DRAFT_497808 [Coemansia mojavensis]